MTNPLLVPASRNICEQLKLWLSKGFQGDVFGLSQQAKTSNGSKSHPSLTICSMMLQEVAIASCDKKILHFRGTGETGLFQGLYRSSLALRSLPNTFSIEIVQSLVTFAVDLLLLIAQQSFSGKLLHLQKRKWISCSCRSFTHRCPCKQFQINAKHLQKSCQSRSERSMN